ncbi:MAG: hypothetical protein U0T82_09105, partial [Bacteroidales bacterium]
MSAKVKVSRRSFFRTAAYSAPVLAGAGVLSSCSSSPHGSNPQPGLLPVFKGKGYQPSDGPSGLLFSQIGYELGLPVKVIVRLPKREFLGASATCELLPSGGEKNYKTSCSYWGEIWGSHWWIARFDSIDEEGVWNVEIRDDGTTVFSDTGLSVGKNILWNKTVELAAADMLERRVHFTKVGAGWQDAGTLWVESCAQSAMVIGLEDLLEREQGRITSELGNRICKQI